MGIMNKSGKRNKSKHITYEKTKYIPPVYPVVDIPVPELDLKKTGRKKSPWYMSFFHHIIQNCCQRGSRDKFPGINQKYPIE